MSGDILGVLSQLGWGVCFCHLEGTGQGLLQRSTGSPHKKDYPAQVSMVLERLRIWALGIACNSP